MEETTAQASHLSSYFILAGFQLGLPCLEFGKALLPFVVEIVYHAGQDFVVPANVIILLVRCFELLVDHIEALIDLFELRRRSILNHSI